MPTTSSGSSASGVPGVSSASFPSRGDPGGMKPRDLTTAMLRFGQVLRTAGLSVTVSEVMDAVRTLEAVDLMDRDELRRALRTVLATRVEEFPAFDRCFDAFWTLQADEGQGLDGAVAASPGAMR